MLLYCEHCKHMVQAVDMKRQVLVEHRDKNWGTWCLGGGKPARKEPKPTKEPSWSEAMRAHYRANYNSKA